MNRIYKVSIVNVLKLVILVGIVFIIGYHTYNYISYMPDKQKADYQTANSIKKAIEKYINDTDDINLQFNNSIAATNIEEVLFKLITIRDNANEPYLDIYIRENTITSEYIRNENYFLYWVPEVNGKHVGWKIVLNKKSKNVSVKPSTTGNKLTIN